MGVWGGITTSLPPGPPYLCVTFVMGYAFWNTSGYGESAAGRSSPHGVEREDSLLKTEVIHPQGLSPWEQVDPQTEKPGGRQWPSRSREILPAAGRMASPSTRGELPWCGDYSKTTKPARGKPRSNSRLGLLSLGSSHAAHCARALPEETSAWLRGMDCRWRNFRQLPETNSR